MGMPFDRKIGGDRLAAFGDLDAAAGKRGDEAAPFCMPLTQCQLFGLGGLAPPARTVSPAWI